MKRTIILSFFCVAVSTAFAQKETFDLVTYSPPKGWKKQVTEGALQFTKEDSTKGSYCAISMFKAVDAMASSKENFDKVWTSLVKEMVTVTSEPEMLAPATESGWEVQSGYASFENDGAKGAVILVTSSGFEKMVNIIILTNTNEYEKKVSAFLESISLQKPETGQQQTDSNEGNKTPAIGTTGASTFKFTTTNFDDGWVSTVQEDWVEVKKDNIIVLLHYPNNKINPANSDPDVVCSAAWNVLVAPRYSDIENYQLTPGVVDYERPYFAQANLTDNVTGKKVFVALFKKGDSGWIEVITTDRNSFLQSFGLDISNIDHYADSKIWEPLQKLRNYNKFAVAATDLKGKWSSSFTGIQQYVNVYTGNDAGMNTHSSSEVFEFAGSNYKWELKVASGFVGNIKFQDVKSNGKFTLLNNWQIHFSEIERKARTYNAYFSCVKGARLL